MIHARYTACVVAPGLVVASEVSVENEWQEKAILTATLMAIGAGIYAVGKPLWLELMSREAPADRGTIEEAQIANAWLKEKQERNGANSHSPKSDAAKTESSVAVAAAPASAMPLVWQEVERNRLACRAVLEEEEQLRKKLQAAAGDERRRLLEEQKEVQSKLASLKQTVAQVCWGCGASGDGYQACSKCVEAEPYMPPCRFCTTGCFTTAWPQHKKWHAATARAREAKERETVAAAVQAVESSSGRISVPVKRQTRKKKSKLGEEPTPPSADDPSEQLERVEKQQALHTTGRERSRLAKAFLQTSNELEAENKKRGLTMWASRADFGKLLVQIDDLLGQAQNAEEVDALFDASAVGGKVDLKDFLARPSTLDWFLEPQSRRAKLSRLKNNDGDDLPQRVAPPVVLDLDLD